MYIISGGLGGLGLVTAIEMEKYGAKHFVLLSRSGRVGAESEGHFQQLKATGADVLCAECDVAKAKDVEAVMEGIQERSLSVKGVVHAAGVLADAAVENQSPETLQQALAAKATGALNLMEATSDTHPEPI